MNKTFREVAQFYRRSQFEELTHSQRVTRLYRASLRSLTDWRPKRHLWNTYATQIRSEFDSHAALAADSGAAKRLLREGEEKLKQYTHPDPYVVPYMPGGSKFMRNPPPALETVFPEGIPAEVHVPAQTVEAIQTPMAELHGQAAPRLLINPYTKRAE